MEYFILLSIPILLMPLYGSRKTRNLYNFIIVFYFIALILFSGLRWQTGTDWDPYLDYFINLDNTRFFEAGYVFLNHLVSLFTDNYSIFLLVDAALAIIPVWIALKKENQCNPLSLAIFFPYYYTVNYLGSNRRIIAIGLCALALLPLKNKKFFNFFILCMIAFLFHRSALVFLLAWPIFHGRYKKYSYISFFFLALICLIWNPILHIESIIPNNPSVVVFQKILIYSGNQSTNPNVNYAVQDTLSILKRIAFLLLMLLGVSRLSDDTRTKYIGYINLYLFSIFLYILFTGVAEIFKSITDYFSIVEIFLIPIAVSSINKHLRPLVYAVLIFYLFSQEYSALLSYWNLYIPYRSILSGGV